MKSYSLFSVILGMTLLVAGLMFSAPTTSVAEPPDILYYVCADPTSRTTFHNEMNSCDWMATSAYQRYNAGILIPHPSCDVEDDECLQKQILCTGSAEETDLRLYQCGGVPGRKNRY